MAQSRVEQDQYFHWGLQYYIAGRFSWFCYFHPITGVLFHHAIEMFLKGKLHDIHTEVKLKNYFKHNLHRLWNEFKILSGDPSLPKYDSTIQQLNKWEDVRYPPAKASSMGSGLRKGKKSKMVRPKMKEEDMYRINLEEMDELVEKLFSVMGVNPRFFQWVLKEEVARNFYRKENRYPLGI